MPQAALSFRIRISVAYSAFLRHSSLSCITAQGPRSITLLHCCITSTAHAIIDFNFTSKHVAETDHRIIFVVGRSMIQYKAIQYLINGWSDCKPLDRWTNRCQGAQCTVCQTWLSLSYQPHPTPNTCTLYCSLIICTFVLLLLCHTLLYSVSAV